jgi:multicomponent Na+:H+ antiporter subunit F
VNAYFIGLAAAIAILAGLTLYRSMVGPTVLDRMLGAGVIGTHGLLLMCLVGFVYERIDMFVDLAIVYALLNFAATVVISKYFEHRAQERPQ